MIDFLKSFTYLVVFIESLICKEKELYEQNNPISFLLFGDKVWNVSMDKLYIFKSWFVLSENTGF